MRKGELNTCFVSINGQTVGEFEKVNEDCEDDEDMQDYWLYPDDDDHFFMRYLEEGLTELVM